MFLFETVNKSVKKKQSCKKLLTLRLYETIICFIKTQYFLEGVVIITWLKDLRTERGISQDIVASMAKMSRAAYANIEAGKRRPSVEAAKRIAGVMGFEWTRFYDEDDLVR